MHLELRREGKEDYFKGESTVGIKYQWVNEIVWSLEGGYYYFSGVLTYQQMHGDNGQSLLKAKINLLLKKLNA